MTDPTRDGWFQRRIKKWLGITDLRDDYEKLMLAAAINERHLVQIQSLLGQTPEEFRQPDNHLPARNRYNL